MMYQQSNLNGQTLAMSKLSDVADWTFTESSRKSICDFKLCKLHHCSISFDRLKQLMPKI